MRSAALPLLGLLLCATTHRAAMQQPPCELSGLEIKGGTYTVTDGGKGTKRLLYKCLDGMYPYPVQRRTCNSSGKWSTMKIDGKTVERALCKEIRCPTPVGFDHGSYSPRENVYGIGSSLHFECYEGYQLRNSANRTCLPNGKWSGETAICDDGSGDCQNPGQPLGSIKNGNQYRIEDKVSYKCPKPLTMFGSQERVCLESGQWSGTEPSCRQAYTFDTAEEVASAFISSLSAAIEVADPNKEVQETGTRKIKIRPDDPMNIYFILDASESVKEENFNKAKDCVISLIEKISTYDITPSYAVVTYATEAQVVVGLEDADSTKADEVIERVKKNSYQEHGSKTGTNTRAAIMTIYEMMSLHEQRNSKKFNATRHVIILMTDGKANMGGDPKIPMLRIRNFLQIGVDLEKPREDFLDVYVFGLGDDLSDDEINGLASKKDKEQHVFKLEDIEDLQKAFDDIIDEEDAMNMCGLAKEYKTDNGKENNPWLATIAITRPNGVENCKGSIVTPHFILTAAHCFTIDDQPHSIQIVTNNGDKYRVKAMKTHLSYKINSKKPKIQEFYDYDITLVEVEKKIPFNAMVRPICIPCTQGTTRALRITQLPTTCKEHRETLLKWGIVEAMFVTEEIEKTEKTKMLTRKTVRIKTGDQKPVCNKDALKASIYVNVTDVAEVVTDRFLCTGGIEPQVDDYTCKGDSGGPLITPMKNRYIQVGVISWGVVNQCKNMERIGRTQAHSRDFHINLFEVLPWLQENLKDEGLTFLPLP